MAANLRRAIGQVCLVLATAASIGASGHWWQPVAAGKSHGELATVVTVVEKAPVKLEMKSLEPMMAFGGKGPVLEHHQLIEPRMDHHHHHDDDLSVLAGHKKYVLVKKKPKHKKIKMEVYKPKMKYKKIKIKVPVKKMKKKKVKGYMIKKEHDHFA